MTLTVVELTAYELAHRMAGEDPYVEKDPVEWSAGVKDWCRTILSEILHLRLQSNLYTCRRTIEGDVPARYFLRSHVEEIEDCIGGDAYPVDLLRFIRINRWDFRLWCKRSHTKPPKFWFSANFELPKGEDETPQEIVDIAKALASTPDDSLHILRQTLEKGDLEPKLEERIQADVRALEIWKEDPGRPIAEVARQLKAEGYGPHVELRTVKDWIEEFGRKIYTRKRGRPRKS